MDMFSLNLLSGDEDGRHVIARYANAETGLKTQTIITFECDFQDYFSSRIWK
jgi:hypothetical protein